MNITELSDMEIIDCVTKLNSKILSAAQIRSNRARKEHLKQYLIDDKSARSAVNERIGVINNLFLYKFIKAHPSLKKHFKKLIKCETDPLITILADNILFYDHLLNKSDISEYDSSGFTDKLHELLQKKTEYESVDFDEMQMENLTDCNGVALEMGISDLKSSQFCNVCKKANLYEEDKQMLLCNCCKAWGHVFKCWGVDKEKAMLGIDDISEWMNQWKKDKKFICKFCKNECKVKQKKKQKKKDKKKQYKICNKYKDDDLFSIKHVSRSELIQSMHSEWNMMSQTVLTALDMWSYEDDKHDMIMNMKKCVDIRLLLLIVEKIKTTKHGDVWESVLNKWGESALKEVCKYIKKGWPDKVVNIPQIVDAYSVFKKKLKQIVINGLLEKSYKSYKKSHRRKTNYKGFWTLERECERLFFSQQILYDKCQQFIRVYDICASLDCIEAKMETIGKHIKYLLTDRNLDGEPFDNEVVLKDNLERIGFDEIFVDRLSKLFLIYKNNRSPMIPKKNRSTKVSQVVDRYLYDVEKQEEEDNDIMRLIEALFKQHNMI